MDDTPRAAAGRRLGDTPASHSLSVALQNVRVLRASLGDAQALLAASRAEETRLRTAHDALAEQCADLRARVIDLEASLGRRTREVAQLRAALEDASRTSADRATVRALQDELAGLRAHISRLASSEESHADALHAMRIQLSSSEARAAEMAMRIAAMAADARARDTQLAATNAELAALQDRYEQQQRSRALFLETIAATRAEIAAEASSLASDVPSALPSAPPSESRRVTFKDESVRPSAPNGHTRPAPADARPAAPGGQPPRPAGGEDRSCGINVRQIAFEEPPKLVASDYAKPSVPKELKSVNTAADYAKPSVPMEAKPRMSKDPLLLASAADPRDPFNVVPPCAQSNADARAAERPPVDRAAARTRIQDIRQANSEMLHIIQSRTQPSV